ncbi:DUF2188 domain-containing protein [Paenibacillus gansuensis]|uniref:DUF2188 domain-containing protein n=1 Tax=Paenibacillus gansuensis TaxID=306542 RepID=A0ABW5P947_9BACL
MANKSIVTLKHGDSWVNEINGKPEGAGKYPTQKEAIEAAVGIAKRRGLEHTIQGENGRFREKNSYGHDPRHIEG